MIPTPDADNTPSADFAHQPANTYDDEMLDAHFSCGDGRCNENIGLSTIHQIFHSEHDRLVDDIKKTLNDNPDLLAAYQAGHPFGADNEDISFGFGSRLFQAARFVTEMEYQHLVFEEFARKVQPAINPSSRSRLSPDDEPGHQGRVRARRLPLRPLDAHRHDLPAQRGLARRHRVGTTTTAAGARTTSRCWTASSTRRRTSTVGRRERSPRRRLPAASSWACRTRPATSWTSS